MSAIRPVLGFLVFVGSIYVVVCVFMYAFQERLVFAPLRGPGPTPRDIGLAYHPVTITTDDGMRLDAWHVPHDEPENTVLFFHGNAGNISGRLETARRMHEMGFEVVMFDYRGFGTSSGSPTEAGTYLDARAMWRWTTEELGRAPQEIVLVGRSLGGAVATELATEVAAKALIVESSFTSVADIGAEAYPWAPVRWLSRIHYDTAARIGRVLCPVLVVHGSADPVVPPAHGRRLFEKATQPKIFLEIPGGHDAAVTVDLDTYRAAWLEFLGASRFPYE